jgi:sporulation protein YlmC with PRC-barrel domain
MDDVIETARHGFLRAQLAKRSGQMKPPPPVSICGFLFSRKSNPNGVREFSPAQEQRFLVREISTMLTKTLSAALLGLSLAAIPAFAQTANTNNANSNTQANKSSDQPHQTASQKNEWPASKIKGLNVYNQNNEKIGDISDLMLNKEGKIDDVVISVGGFLGIGSHDVAVKYSDIKWEMEPVKNTNTSANSSGAAANRPAGSTVGTGTSTNSNSASMGQTKQFWPDHAVLANATKDQLKNMPQFDSTK